MKHFSTLALLPFLLFALSPFSLSAQTTGKEFWICIPPNEILPFPTSALEVNISSEYDTEVEIYDAQAARTIKRSIKAGEMRTLSDTRGETNWTWEIREFEQVVKKGIRIRSEKPIAVHVMNAKVLSTDGYLALPTTAWGLDYIVASYYDFKEAKNWAGGFCIVAKEPTKVTISLNGTGGLDGKTSGGKKLGQTITVDLEAGDVYAVKGDGSTRGLFDLTGTRITANKPIGVLGFHERTTMPNLLVNGNGRNHLVEMLPPTFMWGKKYATVELRRTPTNGTGKGDVFRIIAAEPNTKWNVKYYNKETRALLGQGGGVLTNAGDFADLSQTPSPTRLTNGFSVWEADKPILVIQYSASASFDGDNTHDPFMIALSPLAQFTYRALSNASSLTDFSKTIVTLVVVADSANPDYADNLKSLELNGVPVWNHPNAVSPQIFSNHMGKGLHWTQLEFTPSPGSLSLRANDKVAYSGYVYGSGSVDAYGWPLGSATLDARSTDTMPPVVTGTMNCGTFSGEATELRNIPDPPRATPHDTDQVETGIAEIDTVAGQQSYNYILQIASGDDLPRFPSFKRVTFRFEVIDLSKPAYCVFYVRDWANNYTYDTISYTPSTLALTPDVVRFSERRLNEPDTIDVNISNTGTSPLLITSTTLTQGLHYTLLNGISTPGRTIGAGQTEVIKVVYLADRETNDVRSDFDLDTLLVGAECGTWKIALSGVASRSLIEIEDYNAGLVDPGVLTCKSGGLLITNTGSDTLIITGFTGITNSKFSVSPAALTALPYVIYPKSSYRMTDVCYQRMDEGTDSITVTFQSNAVGPKPTSIWKARTTVTSVEEDAPSAFNITTTTGTITASWQGAGVTRMIVSDLQGRKLGDVAVSDGASNCELNSFAFSSQMIIVALVNDEGSTLYSSKLRLP